MVKSVSKVENGEIWQVGERGFEKLEAMSVKAREAEFHLLGSSRMMTVQDDSLA